MTSDEQAFCESWIKAHAHKWQILNRAQWKYQFRGKAMVRFVNEVQMREEEVRLLLEYLSSDACIATLSAYDQSLGAEWKPIKAWYEIANKSVGAVHAVRLYHGLRTDAEDSDEMFLVEDGCAYKVTLEYHWNESAKPGNVQESTSGVSIRIASISHDPDTDLYSYVIETRERVQQDIAKYLTAESIFEQTYEEAHFGVKQSDVATTGEQASVGNGTLVERKISKNQDCTSDVHNVTHKEKKVPESSVTVQRTLRGDTVVTENRNMTAPASTDDLKPGESVTNTKTRGDLWNTTIRKRVWAAVGWLRKSCRKTIFEHTHTETTNVKDDPGFTHAEEASNGRIVSVDVAHREDDDTYDIRTSTDEEKPVSNAFERIHVGLTGTTRSVTHRNQSEPMSTDGIGIGESVENVRTPGGLWNIVITKLVRRARLLIAQSCSNTIFAHRHGKSTVQSDDPGFTHVEEAGGGKILRKSVSRTSDGAFRIDEDETQEKPVAKSSRTARMTLSGLVVREESRNQPEPLSEDNLEVGDAVTNTKTDGGLWNTAKETAPKKGAGKVSERCSHDKFMHRHTKVENKDKGAPDEAETAFEHGKIVEKSVSLQSNGTKDVATSTTTPKPWLQRYDWRSGDTHHYVVKYGNQEHEFAGILVPQDADTVAKNDHISAFDLHDGQITWSYGPWRTQVSDLKFNKHGVRQEFYFTYTKKHDRKLYHDKVILQVVHIRGDAYTDYVSASMQADKNRSNSGPLAVKLISKYHDKDGNFLAEWVELQGYFAEHDKLCDSNCKHKFVSGLDPSNEISEIINKFTGSASTESSGQGMNKSLDALVNMMMAQFAMNSGATFGNGGQILMPNGMAWNGNAWTSAGGGDAKSGDAKK